MKRLLASVLAVAAFASVSLSANAQTPAVTYTGIDSGSDNRPFTLGWSFNLSASTTVTHLGVWSGGTSGDYLAGIWKSDGTLLASTTVLATDAASNNYRWGSIASLVLGAGTYVVGAEYRGGLAPVFATGLSRIPNLTWIEDRQDANAGLNFPTTVGGDYGDNGILWANFAINGPVSTVPEPSTWALMFVGLAAVGGVSRRRSVKSRHALM